MENTEETISAQSERVATKGYPPMLLGPESECPAFLESSSMSNESEERDPATIARQSVGKSHFAINQVVVGYGMLLHVRQQKSFEDIDTADGTLELSWDETDMKISMPQAKNKYIHVEVRVQVTHGTFHCAKQGTEEPSLVLPAFCGIRQHYACNVVCMNVCGWLATMSVRSLHLWHYLYLSFVLMLPQAISF